MDWRTVSMGQEDLTTDLEQWDILSYYTNTLEVLEQYGCLSNETMGET